MKQFESNRHPIAMRPLLLTLLLAALLIGGCREAAELPPASATGAAPKAAVHAEAPTLQESQGHSHDGATAPHPPDAADQQGMPLSATARANLNLQIAEVVARPIEKILKIPGVIKTQPDRLAYVTPRIEARIEKVYVNVGDTVQQGAPLLDLRSTEIEKLQVELLRAIKV